MTEETAVSPPRGRYVEEEVVTPPPRRPLIWPWLVLLLALVATGIAAAYFLTRDDQKETRVPDVVGLSAASATQRLGRRGYSVVVRRRVSDTARLGTVLTQAPGSGTELDRGSQVTIVVARGPSTVEVPNVVGAQVDQAFVRLQSAGLKGKTAKVASTQPQNRVIRQTPAAGGQAKKGSIVALAVSTGPSLVTVPSVTGLTEASATAMLSRLGFRLSVSRISSTQPKGIVISQSPPSGTKGAKGSVVGIDVSAGSSPATGGSVVPNVVGLSQVIALDRIEQAGFKVDSFPVTSARPRGTIVSQVPAGETRAPPGSLVRINVSLGPGARPQQAVPDVLGEAEADARRVLIRAGFTVRSIDQPTSDTSEKGIVVKQKPTGDVQAAAGSQVVVYVGRLPSPAD